MATFCNAAYTWDANKNKTSESITGVMSGYGFTSGGTTYDFEGFDGLCPRWPNLQPVLESHECRRLDKRDNQWHRTEPYPWSDALGRRVT
ncbi:MAG: hypothetical protein NTV29_11775 [Planctomycetota bacterium]|nr:hypothetical protein [Planctomycetota bacterium]